MSIVVIKSGIADTVQDEGRFGFQHMGINPGGAMDFNAMRIANALVGNDLHEAVIELGYPAATFKFRQPALIALSGADFSPKINGKLIPLNQPCLIPVGTELKFTRLVNGSYSYLSVRGGFNVTPWLDSMSTNTKAKVGGIEGRSLKKNDEIIFKATLNSDDVLTVLPWKANVSEFYSVNQPMRCIQGNEFEWLTKKSQRDFINQSFTISTQSDRMGYRLNGMALKQSKKQELLSSAVTFGTIQLLPDGNGIILMADHQTTGGYPRIAHVVSAERSTLAQYRPDRKISFQLISLEDAEGLIVKQRRSLMQIKTACSHRLNDYLKAHTL